MEKARDVVANDESCARLANRIKLVEPLLRQIQTAARSRISGFMIGLCHSLSGSGFFALLAYSSQAYAEYAQAVARRQARPGQLHTGTLAPRAGCDRFPSYGFHRQPDNR